MYSPFYRKAGMTVEQRMHLDHLASGAPASSHSEANRRKAEHQRRTNHKQEP